MIQVQCNRCGYINTLDNINQVIKVYCTRCGCKL